MDNGFPTQVVMTTGKRKCEGKWECWQMTQLVIIMNME